MDDTLKDWKICLMGPEKQHKKQLFHFSTPEWNFDWPTGKRYVVWQQWYYENEQYMSIGSLWLSHTSLWWSSLLAPCSPAVRTCVVVVVVVVCRHNVWSGVSRWFLPSLSSANLLQAKNVAEVQCEGTHIHMYLSKFQSVEVSVQEFHCIYTTSQAILVRQLLSFPLRPSSLLPSSFALFFFLSPLL